jgi:hypothetical protein
VQRRANGREAWYGRRYLGDRRVNRCLGPKLRRGTGEGLNRTQAEAELRRLMVRERPPESVATISFASAAELMLRELETLGRKATTLENYQAMLRAHLLPRFGELMVDRVRKGDIEDFMAALAEAGKAEKTRSGIFKLLSQVLTYAKRQGWCEQNPMQLRQAPQGARMLGGPVPQPVRARGADCRHRCLQKALRLHRPGDLPNGGDDRNAPRRAPRTSLARRRLGRKADPRAPQLHPRPLVNA